MRAEGILYRGEHLRRGQQGGQSGGKLFAGVGGHGCPKVEDGLGGLGVGSQGGSDGRLVGEAKRPRLIRDAGHGTKVRGRSVAKCK